MEVLKAYFLSAGFSATSSALSESLMVNIFLISLFMESPQQYILTLKSLCLYINDLNIYSIIHTVLL